MQCFTSASLTHPLLIHLRAMKKYEALACTEPWTVMNDSLQIERKDEKRRGSKLHVFPKHPKWWAALKATFPSPSKLFQKTELPTLHNADEKKRFLWVGLGHKDILCRIKNLGSFCQKALLCHMKVAPTPKDCWLYFGRALGNREKREGRGRMPPASGWHLKVSGSPAKAPRAMCLRSLH